MNTRVGLLFLGLFSCTTTRPTETARPPLTTNTALPDASSNHEAPPQLALTRTHVCARFSSAEVRCVLNGFEGSERLAPMVFPASLGIRAVLSQDHSIYLVARDYSLWRFDRTLPTVSAELGGVPAERIAQWPDALQFSSSFYAVCATLRTGGFQCSNGPEERGVRVGWGPVADAGRDPSVEHVTRVALQGSITYAVRSDGTVVAWGRDQSPWSATAPALTAQPQRIEELVDVAEVAPGSLDHACARTNTGEVYCWGSGPGATLEHERRSLPRIRRIEVPRARSIVSGWEHSCALTEDGEVWCWGANSRGQTSARVASVACPTSSCALPPTRVPGVQNAVQLAANYLGTCAVVRDGTVLCWGGEERRTVRAIDFWPPAPDCFPDHLGAFGLISVAQKAESSEGIEFCIDTHIDTPLPWQQQCVQLSLPFLTTSPTTALLSVRPHSPITIDGHQDRVSICIDRNAQRLCGTIPIDHNDERPNASNVSVEEGLVAIQRAEQVRVIDLRTGQTLRTFTARAEARAQFFQRWLAVRDCENAAPDMPHAGQYPDLHCRIRFFDVRSGAQLLQRPQSYWSPSSYLHIEGEQWLELEHAGQTATWLRIPGGRVLAQRTLLPQSIAENDGLTELHPVHALRIDTQRLALVYQGAVLRTNHSFEHTPIGGTVLLLDLLRREELSRWEPLRCLIDTPALQRRSIP